MGEDGNQAIACPRAARLGGDLRRVRPRSCSTWGAGTAVLHWAVPLRRPGHDHFSIDVLPVVIRYATRRANQRGLTNVRFAVKDAQTFLKSYVAPGTIAETHLYHPQPFHDARKAGLRLLTPPVLASIHAALEPGGLVVVQTDNPDYWNYMREVLPAFFDFREQIGPWPDAPEGRTRREILALERGLAVYRGSGFRRDGLTPKAVDSLASALPQPVFRTRGAWCDLDRHE